MEQDLKNLLNLLDDAFGGINFTEEIQKFEEKYKAGFKIRSQNSDLLFSMFRIKMFRWDPSTDLKTLFSSQRELSKSNI